jgi:hypothetical protein
MWMKRDRIVVACIGWMFLFFQTALAQIPIEKEPHHKVVFENQVVRVIDLVVPPHDTTLLHTHNAASVVIFLSASSFAIRNPKQAPAVTQVKLGDIVYRDYDKKPVAHTVWSADTSVFRCLVVEMKQK